MVFQPTTTEHENGVSSLAGSIAVELKIPLIQIARQIELAQLECKPVEETLLRLDEIATDALKLMDSYSLGLELGQSQQLLELEPLSVPAVLYDAAQDLTPIAKRYGVTIDLQATSGTRHRLVMANRSGLRAVLLNLGSVFVESSSIGSADSAAYLLASAACV